MYPPPAGRMASTDVLVDSSKPPSTRSAPPPPGSSASSSTRYAPPRALSLSALRTSADGEKGTYKEQVYIPARKAQLTVYGYTTDTSSYGANTVTITQALSQDEVAKNDLTATLRAHAAGLKVYNINLENTRGVGRQALAVSAQGDQQGYYGVKFIGYQDTILANDGNQVYARCYIDGAIDFIFGQRARAYFYKADIRIKGSGYITANGRDSDSNVSYYVIANSDIRAAPNVSVAAGAVYLGRPWRNYSRGTPSLHPPSLLEHRTNPLPGSRLPEHVHEQRRQRRRLGAVELLGAKHRPRLLRRVQEHGARRVRHSGASIRPLPPRGPFGRTDLRGRFPTRPSSRRPSRPRHCWGAATPTGRTRRTSRRQPTGGHGGAGEREGGEKGGGL